MLLAALGKREKVTVFGTDYPTPDGTCIRDYIHVEDLCAAHIVAMNALQPGDARFYNLGIGNGYSVKEVIESAAARDRPRIPGRVRPAASRRSGRLCLPTPTRSAANSAGRPATPRSTRSSPRPGIGSKNIPTDIKTADRRFPGLLKGVLIFTKQTGAAFGRTSR